MFINDSRFPSIKIFLSNVIFSFILFWYSVLSIFGSPEKRETSNSRHVADYDSAVHSATTMKRKTIKRTGQLFFPIDINDIQSEVEISSESNHETPSLICANDTVSNVIPDHDYHTFWATPILPLQILQLKQLICPHRHSQHKQLTSKFQLMISHFRLHLIPDLLVYRLILSLATAPT